MGDTTVVLPVTVWPTMLDDVVWVPSNAPATVTLPLAGTKRVRVTAAPEPSATGTRQDKETIGR